MTNTHNKTCIIIGASHGGGQAAISLRQSGWDGHIILIGAEPYPPYHRPPLSKDFLSGGKDIEDIFIRPIETYTAADITVLTGYKARAINREDRLVVLEDGETLHYDKLVLATGARPRELSIPGGDIPGVHYLRTAQDVLAIKDKVESGKGAVIIGGGYIGLEAAASLTKQGMKVTVLEMEDRILKRVTAPVMSDFYRRIHTEEGVEIVENCTVTHIFGNKNEMVALTNTGHDFEGKLLIAGIGVLPNTLLAKNCGLEVGNGIIVNEFCQTSDPDIYAIGDVTWHHNPIYDTFLRLESVPNATEQAKTAALSICEKPKPYNALPWFWSDQFDLKLQIAGLSAGYDDIVLRGNPDKGRSFAAFYFKGDQLLAVDAVNRPGEFMLGKRLIPLNKTIDKKALADEAVALKTFLK
ncbi:MAG: FAD-dependent oxidoreductase [Robiginitomaculum sp.]|nr:FAD-dependent oxidoreductase [Robiginitomaculum sp.]